METTNIHEIVNMQRAYFQSGNTLKTDWRIARLKELKKAVEKWEPRMTQALAEDLGRSEAEAYFCDIGSFILEINETIRGLRRWAAPEIHFSGLHCFPSVITRVYKKPYGVTLIISPFNFPFLLSLGVLICAIAGGNTAVLKASSKSASCTRVLKAMIEDTFPPDYVTVIDGGHEQADACLAERFDKIFYTGSPAVGKHVLAQAAKNLTPVALELGGESGNWAVIRKDADIRDAARKIAFFKLLNSGQICINVNQVAVACEVAEAFVRELKAAFSKQIGPDALCNDEYPRLISKASYEKCASDCMAYADRIVYGGDGDAASLRYQPTILYPVGPEEEIVQRELFNPILPVVPFEDKRADELMRLIASREHGLALYVFTKDRKWAEEMMATQPFGGGCINEVCLHLMVRGVPFNGTGHSGMGAYHGEWGFREFTYPCTVLKGSTRFNLKLREHPYTGEKLRLLRFFEK